MAYSDLKGKKVLVTGSSSGIGAATAELFAKEGCFVGVHYFETRDGGKATLEKVKALSDGILLKADMRSEREVTDMVAAFATEAGGIDILINNAGTLIARFKFDEATLDFFEDIFATNVRSVFLATRAALPHLKKSQGCIVNIGSVAGHNGGGGGSGIYSAAKAAVHTMTIAMAKEFGPSRIRVNTVCPGLIETRFHERFSTPERRAAMAKDTPVGRNGTAQDIANAIVFLASDAASFIDGENLAVNGGALMRP
jgi:3-oxoacyl-[acyl-carrier protein] reductase